MKGWSRGIRVSLPHSDKKKATRICFHSLNKKSDYPARTKLMTSESMEISSIQTDKEPISYNIQMKL